MYNAMKSAIIASTGQNILTRRSSVFQLMEGLIVFIVSFTSACTATIRLLSAVLIITDSIPARAHPIKPTGRAFSISAGITASAVPYSSIRLGRSCLAARAIMKTIIIATK